MAIKMTKELLTTKPEEIAKRLISEKGKNDKHTTTTQIRKFYNDFLVLKRKADLVKEDEFVDKILTLISFSKAKLAYSCGRKTITKEFVLEIGKLVDEIESKSDFETFLYFYQALIGYATFWNNSKDEKDLQKKHEVEKKNNGNWR